MRSRRRSWSLLGATLLLAGCGSAAISEDASSELLALVDATWDAAELGDAEAASGELDTLRTRARELHEDGELEQGRLEEVLAAADEVDARLGLLGEREPVEVDDDGDDDRDDGDDGDDDDDDRDDDDEKEKDKGKDKDKDEDDEDKDDEDKDDKDDKDEDDDED